MSAAALAQRLRNGAVPGLNQVERNGWNAGTYAFRSISKQAATEGETPGGTAGTGGTGVFAGVGEQGAESGLKRTHPDDVGASWRPLAVAYQAHHFGCPVCVAAGKGYGLRCGAGAALWRAYAEHQPGSTPKTDEA